MDEFLLRAMLAGVALAIIAAPIGCFVVWRRMAYFGATLSHAALLGVALGVALEFDVRVGVLLVSLLVGVLLHLLRRERGLTMDTLLGILAHGALAIGLVVIAFLDHIRVDLMAYLFGDILAVSQSDVLWMWAAVLGIVLALGLIWRRLLAVTVNADLARVDGEPIELIELGFLLLISLVVALAMQVVGLLLIVSMMIIPPAIVRPWVKSPEAMAIAATGIGALTVFIGLALSMLYDLPAGPAIVSAATALFALSVGVSPKAHLPGRAG